MTALALASLNGRAGVCEILVECYGPLLESPDRPSVSFFARSFHPLHVGSLLNERDTSGAIPFMCACWADLEDERHSSSRSGSSVAAPTYRLPTSLPRATLPLCPSAIFTSRSGFSSPVSSMIFSMVISTSIVCATSCRKMTKAPRRLRSGRGRRWRPRLRSSIPPSPRIIRTRSPSPTTPASSRGVRREGGGQGGGI